VATLARSLARYLPRSYPRIVTNGRLIRAALRLREAARYCGAMSQEDVELDRQNRDLEVLRKVYSHWERGDFTYSEVFAEDYVWKAVDVIESGEYTGFAEVSPAWRTWLQAWDDFCIEAEEMIAGPDGRYVVMQLFRGKGKASGLESEERSAVVVTMQDGLIARMEGYWDRDAALQAARVGHR
jgi:ketosteroid isomerase-like protein